MAVASIAVVVSHGGPKPVLAIVVGGATCFHGRERKSLWNTITTHARNNRQLWGR